MTDQDYPELQSVIAHNLRRLRDERGDSQAHFAARILGLDWTQSTVAQIERGYRPVNVDELLLLPLLLECELWELLDHDGPWIRVGKHGRVEPKALKSIVTGKRPKPSPSAREVAERFSRESAEHELKQRAGPLLRRVAAVIVDKASHPDNAIDRAAPHYTAHHQSRREPEGNAARALGLDPLEVVELSYRLWGQGLTEERDEIAAAQAQRRDVDPARRLGWVTRELIDQLETELDRKRRRR
ncbi:MAG: helix-turn-helix domain-containing protein [Actinomycetota bacterium]